MKQQVIYSMLAMAAVPGTAFATEMSGDTINSPYVLKSAGTTQIVNSNQTVELATLKLTKGVYRFSENPTPFGNNGSKWLFTVKGAKKVLKGSELVDPTAEISTEPEKLNFAPTDTFEVEKDTVVTIEVTNKNNGNYMLTDQVWIELVYDWDNEELAAWKTAMKNYMLQIGNYRSPEYTENKELQRLNQAANYLGQPTNDPAVVVDDQGTQLLGARWDSYAVYHLHGLGDIQNLYTRMNNVMAVINKAEAEYEANQIAELINTYNFDGLLAKVDSVEALGTVAKYTGETKKFDAENGNAPLVVKEAGTEVKIADACQNVRDSITHLKDTITKAQAALLAQAAATPPSVVDISNIQESMEAFQNAAAAVRAYELKLEKYNQFLDTAKAANAELDYYKSMLDNYKLSIANGEATIDQFWVRLAENETGMYRMNALALDSFLIKAEAEWASENTEWTSPANLEIIAPAYPEAKTFEGEDYEFGVNVGTPVTFANIKELLQGKPQAGVDDAFLQTLENQYQGKFIAAPIEKAGDEIPAKFALGNGIRCDIATLKYMAKDYINRYLGVIEAYDAAVVTYNEKVTDLENHYKEKETLDQTQKTWYDELLVKAKDSLQHAVLDSITAVRDSAIKAKQNGSAINLWHEVGDANALSFEFTGLYNETKTNYTVWMNKILALLDKLGTVDAEPGKLVYGWAFKASEARRLYNRLLEGIDGEERNIGDNWKTAGANRVLKWIMDEIDFETLPEYFKDANQEEWNAIVADTALLKHKADSLNETMDSYVKKGITEYDMAITTNWDAMTDANWQRGDDDGHDYSSWKNLRNRLLDLKKIADKARKNQAAYFDLLSFAETLAARLKNASDSIDSLTAQIEPTYKGSEFYGFKAVDDPTTDVDEALANTGYAKEITDFIAVFKDTAEAYYNRGEAEKLLLGNGKKVTTFNKAEYPQNNGVHISGTNNTAALDKIKDHWYGSGTDKIDAVYKAKDTIQVTVSDDPGDATFGYYTTLQEGRYIASFTLSGMQGDPTKNGVEFRVQAANGIDDIFNEPYAKNLGNGTWTVEFEVSPALASASDEQLAKFFFLGKKNFTVSNLRFDLVTGAGFVTNTPSTQNIKIEVLPEEMVNYNYQQISDSISRLEKGGLGYLAPVDGNKYNAFKATENFVEQIAAWKKDSAKVDTIYKKVKDHPIYKDRTDVNELKYYLLINYWNTKLNVFKAGNVDPAMELTANKHWAALATLSYGGDYAPDFVSGVIPTPTQENPDASFMYAKDGYLDMTPEADGNQITIDKAAYAEAALKQRVKDLNKQLQGTPDNIENPDEATNRFNLNLRNDLGTNVGDTIIDDVQDGIVYTNGKIADVILNPDLGWQVKHDDVMDPAKWEGLDVAPGVQNSIEELWQTLRDSIVYLETGENAVEHHIVGRKQVWSEFDPTQTISAQQASDSLLAIAAKIEVLLALGDNLGDVKLTKENNINKLYEYSKAIIDTLRNSKELRDSLVGKNYEPNAEFEGLAGAFGQQVDTLMATYNEIVDGGKFAHVDVGYRGALDDLADEFRGFANLVDKDGLDDYYGQGTLLAKWAETTETNEQALKPAFELAKKQANVLITKINFLERLAKTQEALQTAITLIEDNPQKYGDNNGRKVFLDNLKSFNDEWTRDNIDSIAERIGVIKTDTAQYKIDEKFANDSAVIDTMLNVLGNDLAATITNDIDVHSLDSFVNVGGGEFLKGMPLDMILRELKGAEANKTAYDQILTARQALADRCTELLGLLSDNTKFPQTLPSVIKVKDSITNYYVPVPDQLMPQIAECYANGEAVKQAKETKQYKMVGDVETFDYYPLRAILIDSLNALNNLYNELADPTAGEMNEEIWAENNQKYADVLTAYQGAMAAYNKAVKALDDFKTPEDPELLMMYQNAFDKFNAAVVYKPSTLLVLKENALAHKQACDKVTVDSEPHPTRYADQDNGYFGADYNAIAAEQANIEGAFDQFKEDLKTAMNLRWNGGQYDQNTTIAGANNATNGYKAQLQKVWNQIVTDGWFINSEGDKFSDKCDITSTKYGWEVFANETYNWFASEVNTLNGVEALMDLENEGQAANSEFLQFDAKVRELASETNGFAAMLKGDFNAAANCDLTSRIAMLDKQIAVDRGPAAPVLNDTVHHTNDKIAELIGQLNGVGKVSHNDVYYTYRMAVNFNRKNNVHIDQEPDRTWEDYVALFNKIESLTRGKANKLREDYANAIMLPNDTVGGGDVDKISTRDTVLALIDDYDNDRVVNDLEGNQVKKWDDIWPILDQEYGKFISQAAFIDNYIAFSTRFKEDSTGIADLIVGYQYAGSLLDFSTRLSNTLTQDDLNDLITEFDALVDQAKADEYQKMITELNVMYADYNQKVALNDPDGMTQEDGESAAEYAARQEAGAAKVHELQTRYSSGTDAFVDDEENEQFGTWNIKLNSDTLKTFEEGRLDPTNPDKKHATWAEYLAIEEHVAKIKAAIYYDTQEEQEAAQQQMIEDLNTALDNMQVMSQYITGQNLFNPSNPAFIGDNAYISEDFGLYKYYREGYRGNLTNDFKELKDTVAVKLIAALQAIQEDIAKHNTNKDVLLYYNTIQQAIADLQAEAQRIDTKWNDPEDENSAYAKNLALLPTIDVNVAKKKDLLTGDVKTLEDLVDLAVEMLEEMGTPEDEIQQQTGGVNEAIAGIKSWINAMYLGNQLKEDSEIPTDAPLTGSEPSFKVDENGTPTDNYWKISKTIDQCSNEVRGLVEAKVDALAQREYQKAEVAFNQAEDILRHANIKKATRQALLELFTPNSNGSVFEEEHKFADSLAILKDQAAPKSRVYDPEAENSIFAYVKDVKRYIESLGFTYNENGELVIAEPADGFLSQVQDELIGDLDSGDGTGDGVIDVFDLTALLEMVTNPEDQPNPASILRENYDSDEAYQHAVDSVKAVFAAYDLNSDGKINVVDLGIELDLMGGKTFGDMNLARLERTNNEKLTAAIVAKEGNIQRIAISLSNTRQYTAFQMDVVLPEGMTLAGKELGERATTQTLYNNKWGAKQRIVAFTMGRDAFTGEEGAVLYLDVETSDNFRGGKIQYEDITFLTTDGKGVNFKMAATETTGIMDRIANAADAAKQTIYNMGGRMVETLKKGVNIIRGNNGDAEKVIKK